MTIYLLEYKCINMHFLVKLKVVPIKVKVVLVKVKVVCLLHLVELVWG